MNFTIDQALQQAIKEHKTGNLIAAENLYLAILDKQPQHPHANHNLGALYSTTNKNDDALPFFEVALKCDPNYVQFWESLLNALVNLSRFEHAQGILDEALKRGVKLKALKKRLNLIQFIVSEPENPTGYFDLAMWLNENQKHSDAVLHLKKAVKLKPSFTDAYIALGLQLYHLRNWVDATRYFQFALKLDPNREEALFNLGNLHSLDNDFFSSILYYRRVLEINPNNADAFNNLGNSYKGSGSLPKAILAYLNSLRISKSDAAYQNLSLALTGIRLSAPVPGLSRAIEEILEKKILVRPKDIAQATVSILKFNPDFRELLSPNGYYFDIKQGSDVIKKLSNLSLFAKLLECCPIPDLEIEDLLCEIRSFMLNSISKIQLASQEIEFYSALAVQCYVNEFIYNETEDEARSVNNLSLKIEEQLKNGIQPTSESIICLASYRRLYDFSWIHEVQLTSEINKVLTVQVVEPNVEENLKQKIVGQSKFENVVSKKIQAQYEAHPYPRWTSLAIPITRSSFRETLRSMNLQLADPNILTIKKPRILVAGCGTGQQSIGTATRFPSSEVIAIDLSSSSLAYATRKTVEYGIRNISYQQCDILDVASLGISFDIIECVGVLHHMEDPALGLSELTKCLKSGGLIKLGLYSELARSEVTEFRRSINNFDLSDSQIRYHRGKIIRSKIKEIQDFTSWSDFYSLSEFKDLLLNIQEHTFSIPQLQIILREANLDFCGFEHRRLPFIQAKNTGLKIHELSSWDRFEKDFPKTFRGMYQLWCQKL